MDHKKVVFKYFTIAQYQQEEAYLSFMNENGWKLTKIIFPGFYHFEKCEPQKVTYRLDYNQEGMKNIAEYVQMFSDCGWNYLFNFAGYSYFCKKGTANQEAEEIFCDESSRFDMMKRVLKGRFIPLIILFACVILPQLFATTVIYRGGMPYMVQNGLSITFLVLAILYLAIFSVTAYQFSQYEQRLYPEKTSVKYKYWGISFLMILCVICIVLFFYFSRRSVYSVSERASGFTIEAEQLNKSIVMEYNLKKGDFITVSHDFDGGELFIRVGEENKDPIFYGNSYGEFEDFILEIQEDGRYKIECSGRQAKGIIRFAIE